MQAEQDRFDGAGGVGCRFLGADADVDIATPDPEFRAWKWADPADLPAMIVPFKKKLYEQVVAAFRDRL